MSLSDSPHLVFLPSGIGNPTLFLRLAAKMASLNCRVTFINLQPQPVDRKFSDQPRVEFLDFEIEADDVSDTTITDPFIARVATVNRALYRLDPILSSSHAHAIISDFAIAATIAEISDDLSIPLYIVSTTSAQFLALVANVPLLLSRDSEVFSSSSAKCSGAVESQRHSVEHFRVVRARNAQQGYKQPSATTFPDRATANLRERPSSSMVKRTTCSISGVCRLWATQPNSSGEFDGFSGESCIERHEKGVIVRGGIDQERVLADPAVGLFVNQCEWQSIMQAAWEGVPVLAWPQHGDQNMNAEAVEKIGLGVWMKECGGGGEKVVNANRIGQLVGQMMQDLNIKKAAKIVRESSGSLRKWRELPNGFRQSHANVYK